MSLLFPEALTCAVVAGAGRLLCLFCLFVNFVRGLFVFVLVPSKSLSSLSHFLLLFSLLFFLFASFFYPSLFVCYFCLSYVF